MGGSGILVDFIRRARRRFIANQVYEQVILALGAGFAGVILLLLVGTQILDWYWPVLLFGAGLGVGAYRLRGRIPSEYEAAQRVDSRLKLQDTLSTAAYFLRHPDRGGTPADVRAAQLASAEQMASGLPVSEAAPWRMPRSAYASLALALVACGMIGVRYGINHRLDLQSPIAKFEFDTFRSRNEVARTKQREQEKKLDEQFKQMGLALDDEHSQNQKMERQNETAQEAIDGEKNAEPKTKTEKRQEQGLTSSDEQGPEQQQGAEAEEGKEQPSSGNDQSASASQPGQKADKPDAGQQQANQNENSSLMDKMRNALANMLAKMKMQPQNGQGQQMASASKGSLQNGQQQQQKMDQQGQPSQGKEGQQQGQPSSEGKGNQEGQGNQQSQPGEGQQGSNSSDKPSSQDSKTGMGKSDGNKDVKMAEQLEAMGKISEIIGKRSQSLTGEMMVEVASGKQQLKTSYTQRDATHGEAGGEIHRDEVPLALQQYVRQYFEEVRKTAQPGKGKKDGLTGKGASN